MSYQYLEQISRVHRFLNRIRDKEKERIQYEDDLWSFFQNCWHLKDWIKNDPKVSDVIKSNIGVEIYQYESLRICADLANRSKHLVLRNIRIDANIPGRQIVAVVGSTSTVTWDYRIVIKDGKELKATAVAEQAVKDWEAMIINWKLPYPKDY